MVLWQRRLLLLLRPPLLRLRLLHQVAPVVLPGLAEPRLEVPEEVQVVLPEEVQVVLLGLEALLELEALPEPLPLVGQALSLERFLLLVLRLQVLEWSVWSALQ